VVLVYDITSTPSFDHVASWLKDVSAVAPGITAVLVGNKVDLASARTVPTAKGAALAKELGVPFFEASANMATGVEAVFARMAADLVGKALAELGVVPAAKPAGVATAAGGSDTAASKPERVELKGRGGGAAAGAGDGSVGDAPPPSRCAC